MKSTVARFLSPIIPAASRPLAAGVLLLVAPGFQGSAPAQTATNAPPDRLTYQGYLVDANGNALAPSTPANFLIVFRIWTAANSGTRLWTEQQIVTVDKGNFSVVLGEGTLFPGESRPPLGTILTGSTDTSERYIGINVTISGTPTEILPRLRLLPSPYAFLAGSARSLTAPNGTTLVTHTNNRTEVTGNLFASGGFFGSGAGLTGVKVVADDITGGTIPTARLPNNLAFTNAINNFTANQFMHGNLGVLGNIGIGESWSTIPLSFKSIPGEKISFWAAPNGDTFGIGFVANPIASLNIHAIPGSDIALGNGNSATMVDAIRIKGLSGFVGIGTSTPLAKLHTVGGATVPAALTDSASSSGTWSVLRNTSTGGTNWHMISTGSGNTEGAGKLLFTYGSTPAFAQGTAMALTSSGHVGLGTANPTQAKLVVVGGPRYNTGPVGYLDYLGAHAGESLVNETISIYASGGSIWGSLVIASSDQRIKRIHGRSDSAADLHALRGIEITDYHYKDQIREGGLAQKKVIGQQLERVFPQAVSKRTETVPDIFQSAPCSQGWVMLATDLKKGERVKLITDKNEESVHEVLEVFPDKFRTGFVTEGARVFVYGREVDDFRTVDYDAIAMLNVSATQELAKRLETLEARESRLADLEAKASRVVELESEVAELKKMVAQLAAITPLQKQAAQSAPATLPSPAAAFIEAASAGAGLDRQNP